MSRLEEKIEEYKEEFRKKAPIEVQKVMSFATEKLKNTKLSQNALKTGDKIKNFTLPNAKGDIVDLQTVLLGYDYVVLTFYRGGWCPYCNLELRALQEVNAQLVALNTRIIAISPQTPDHSLSTKEKAQLEYEVLSDIDNIVAKEFGLVFSLDESLRAIYKQFNIDIESSNNSHTFEIPMPATYIVDKNREIIYHFVDEDYTKRLDPEIILQQIKKQS